jgi:hypothetical protein
MATEPIPHSPILRRLATDLDATSVESRLARNGDLIAEMHAMGHRFRFRIAASDGRIIERFCQADPDGVLSRPEMQVLRDLAEAELARMGRGHLTPERHGSDVFAVLSRAEIKLSLTLASGEALSKMEREVISRALEEWSAGFPGGQCDPRLRSDAQTVVAAIEQKLHL